MKILLIALLLFPGSLLGPRAFIGAEDWNGWRGPRGDGTSLEKNVPARWDSESGKNIRWKAKLPGEGHASPIVWNDRLFVVSCLKESKERILLCLKGTTGEALWRRTVVKSVLETKHRLNSFASSTPATDGKLLVVTFLEVDGRTIPAPNVGTSRPVTPGRIVVVAYDLDGNRKWLAKPGEFVSAHGFCSSPVLYEDLVIVNGDHDGDAYIVAVDRNAGETRWKVPRENKFRSYVTPIIRQIDGRAQLVLSGSESVASYDPRTGERHWFIDGPTEQFVASMVYDGKLFFMTAGYPDRHILAIRPDGKGDVTDTHIAWRASRGAAYVPSPVLVGKYLLVVSDKGIASCFDTATGERYWMERIGPGYSASLVAADGLVYFLSDNGVTTVVRAGSTFEVVAENKLGETCSASPAISGDRIFFRGKKHLYCIGRPNDS